MGHEAYGSSHTSGSRGHLHTLWLDLKKKKSAGILRVPRAGGQETGKCEVLTVRAGRDEAADLPLRTCVRVPPLPPAHCTAPGTHLPALTRSAPASLTVEGKDY